MAEERIAVTIHPESPESCRGCELLKGINVAQCVAGFTPRFDFKETIRPQECRDAVKTMELTKLYLGTWNNLP